MAAHKQAQDFHLKFNYLGATGHLCFTAQASFGLVNGDVIPLVKHPFRIFAKPLGTMVFFTPKGTPSFIDEPTPELAKEIRRLGKAVAQNPKVNAFLHQPPSMALEGMRLG